MSCSSACASCGRRRPARTSPAARHLDCTSGPRACSAVVPSPSAASPLVGRSRTNADGRAAREEPAAYTRAGLVAMMERDVAGGLRRVTCPESDTAVTATELPQRVLTRRLESSAASHHSDTRHATERERGARRRMHPHVAAAESGNSSASRGWCEARAYQCVCNQSGLYGLPLCVEMCALILLL